MGTLTISQAARAAGVNVETIRFYERKGLLQQPPTPAHGHRRYEEDAVLTVRFIKRAQELGFSLAEIEDLLALRQGTAPCADARTVAEQKLAAVEAKLDDLFAVKRALETFIDRCRQKDADASCPLLDSLDFERRTSAVSPLSQEKRPTRSQ